MLTYALAATPQVVCYGVATAGNEVASSYLKSLEEEATQDGALNVWREEKTCPVTGSINVSLMAEVYFVHRPNGCRVYRH